MLIKIFYTVQHRVLNALNSILLILLTQVKFPMYNWYRRPVAVLLLEVLLEEPLVTGVLFWLLALGGLSTGCLDWELSFVPDMTSSYKSTLSLPAKSS